MLKIFSVECDCKGTWRLDVKRFVCFDTGKNKSDVIVAMIIARLIGPAIGSKVPN